MNESMFQELRRALDRISTGPPALKQYEHMAELKRKYAHTISFMTKHWLDRYLRRRQKIKELVARELDLTDGEEVTLKIYRATLDNLRSDAKEQNPRNPFPQYNCLEFVFENSTPAEKKDIWHRYRAVYKQVSEVPPWLKALHREHFLPQLHPRRLTGDSIAVYFDGDIPKHFARVFSTRYVSKWGPGGLLWCHGKWEVPLEYGDQVCYSPLDVNWDAFETAIREFSSAGRNRD